MKAINNLLKDQRGMTGLETAIILIAFVTIAAVFGYAVLSAGLFSAERGKETIYAGLNEARSNLELSGSVMARSDDNANVRSILFTVKNAIAGNPIDLTPCNGTSNASNKCAISLSTASDYINNVKWTKVAIGANDGNDLLETGEQFEITVDLTDLGAAGSLSENLTANDKFSLQVKPALGSTITIQRTLPASIGPIMDLDLMFGSGGSGSGGTGGGQTYNLSCSHFEVWASTPDYIDILYIDVTNNGTSAVTIDMPDVSITSDDGTHVVTNWFGVRPVTLLPGFTEQLVPDLGPAHTVYTALDLNPGETFTVHILPGSASELNITKTLPGSWTGGSTFSLP